MAASILIFAGLKGLTVLVPCLLPDAAASILLNREFEVRPNFG